MPVVPFQEFGQADVGFWRSGSRRETHYGGLRQLQWMHSIELR